MRSLRVLILIAIAGTATSSPLPGGKEIGEKVLYDQRQEGELNVRADLKNFVILIIPTPTVPNASNTPSLLDFFSKSIPLRTHAKRVKPIKSTHHDAAEETQHFIEAKTAPYHVDITKTKGELAKLHPANEEVILATSPNVALLKTEPDSPSIRTARSSRAFVLTVPEEKFTVTKTEDVKKVVKKDGKKIMKEAPTKHSLKLLGAENEQCGPDMERDDEGVCRISRRL